jgi:hypothetical protein
MAGPSGKFHDWVVVRRWASLAVLALALLLRLSLLSTQSYPFNSDEAIVALMARHILAGEWPIFFYGQAYMGSLDASLVAFGFNWLGQETWVIRFVQVSLYIGIIVTSMQLSSRLSRSRVASIVTGLLLAVPTVNLNLYTTVSLGGYGEALLIGNLILLIALDLRTGRRSIFWLVLLGLFAGLGLWAFGLTLIYIVPAFVLLVSTLRSDTGSGHVAKTIIFVLAGFLMGAAPILVWAGEHGVGQLVSELLGGAIAGTSQGGYWSKVGEHALNFLFFGPTVILGLRAPWDTRIFLWSMAVVVVLFYLAVFTQYVRLLRGKGGDPQAARTLGAVALILILGFLLTPFGGDPSGRYFLPMTILTAIIAGSLFTQDGTWLPRGLKWGLFTTVIVYQLMFNLQVALRSESGFTTQFDPVARIDHTQDRELIQYLLQKGETRGYTNYWVAYPLAFKSSEEIIFVPRLPYHQDLRYTPRDNRYDRYNSVVGESDEVAYITTKNPALNELIRSRFNALKLTWQEQVIGDYRIFYDLSEAIAPEQLDDRFVR